MTSLDFPFETRNAAIRLCFQTIQYNDCVPYQYSQNLKATYSRKASSYVLANQGIMLANCPSLHGRMVSA